MVSLQNRFRGLMAGIAVGDCLGRPFEGAHVVPQKEIDGYVARNLYLPYSDDTALSLALAESLLACDGFEGADMAQRFAETWSERPDRGYGGGVIQLFGQVKRGHDWQRAAERQFGGTGSYGNGGAMRVAPVALWAYPDIDSTIELAKQTARVTHTHPVGIEGAVIQAVACHHALRDDFSTDRLLNTLDDLIETEQFRAKFEILPRALDKGDEWAGTHLGQWVAADKSVLTALYAFLASAGFEETIRRAIGLGGDTDTIAAMAGAIAGTRWGVESIPKIWRKVEAFDQLVELSDRFYEMPDSSRSLSAPHSKLED